MFSRCRVNAMLLLMLALAATAGCERERREYHSAPDTSRQANQPRLTSFQPGVQPASDSATKGAHYEQVSFHISEGGRLFRSYNCNGCHGAGGGAIGPALMDDQWRYGGNIDQIHASILDGRPNGMPSWRGKLTDVEAWQLAAYVRSLSGNVPKDVAPGRRDTLTGTPPSTQMDREPIQGADPSAQQPPPP
jgi:cytochrome c oxidase cbb3-type subunit III